ncbi:MAG: BspA family leucine-rich repeat surface protein [bacterium]
MKKRLFTILTISLLFFIFGCGDKKSQTNDSGNSGVNSETDDDGNSGNDKNNKNKGDSTDTEDIGNSGETDDSGNSGNTEVDNNIQIDDPEVFVSVWKIKAYHSVILPLVELGTYDFTVKWGDGTENYITTWDDPNLSHEYDSDGDYVVQIKGVISGWQFCAKKDQSEYDLSLDCNASTDKIVDIKQWGTLSFGDTHAQFASCNELNITAEDAPDLSETKTLELAFYGNNNLKGNSSFPKWDVSNITNMRHMFSGVISFNADIGNWDVSNVTDMESMFRGARNFNKDITKWDVSKATTLNSMFSGANNFNQDIGLWDVSNVTNTGGMFSGARSFNQDISCWDVSNVTYMHAMFEGAINFNQDIGNWSVSRVGDMGRMFKDARAFNQDIGKWNVSGTSNMKNMFENAKAFNQDLSNWCVRYIHEKPEDFDTDANAWVLPRPVWGTCP